MLSQRGINMGICGAFDFSENILVKIPTIGPPKWVKSDQISPAHTLKLQASAHFKRGIISHPQWTIILKSQDFVV